MSDLWYAIEDMRTDKVYLDQHAMIRNFERIIGTYRTLQEAQAKHPEGIELSLGEKA